MAISPQPARHGRQPQLSEEELRRLDAVEKQVDERLAKAFEDTPGTASLGLALDNCPIGTFTPAMQANFIARYTAAGWNAVGVTEHENNYSVQLNL